MDRIGGFFERGAAVIHAELAIGRRIPDVAVVAEDRIFDAHRVEDAFHFAQIADGVAVEAADKVDLLVRHAVELRRRAGLAIPEMLDHALHDIVVAGDVAADEGGRVGEGNVEFLGNRALFLGGLDEGVEIVADDFRHAGRGNRDHLRLIHIVGVGEAVDHIVEAAEHRRVFGHRGGDAGGRLLEVTREVRAIIGDAALAAMDEGNRALKSDRRENRAERLTSLRRIDGQGLASEILFAIFLGLGPFAHPFKLGVRDRIFEVLLLVLEHLLVFRLAEQVEMVEDVVLRSVACRFPMSVREPPRSNWSGGLAYLIKRPKGPWSFSRPAS